MGTQIPCFVARHKEAGTISVVHSKELKNAQ